jgi:hypothetical protein
MPRVGIEGQRFNSPHEDRDQNRYQGGIAYFYKGHNINIKAGYGVIDPRGGRTQSLFTVQLQVFYF